MSWPFIDLCKESSEDCGCSGECTCCSYQGPNLPASGIVTGDSIDVAIQKLDAVLFNVLYPNGTTTTTSTLTPTTTTTTTLTPTTTTTTTLTPTTTTTTTLPLIVPIVITNAVTDITSTTATGNGEVTVDGSPQPITFKGFVFGTSPLPDNSDNLSGGGSGVGVYSAALDAIVLTPGTLYYVRAVVNDGASFYYGNEVTFTTDP